MGKKILLILYTLASTLPVFAGIDYSRYGDAPAFFFGWQTSFFFAIGAIVLFFISSAISKESTNSNGEIDKNGCLLCVINIAMIICGICSYYLLLPLGILYIILRKK